jgi:hypothetical protein
MIINLEELNLGSLADLSNSLEECFAVR